MGELPVPTIEQWNELSARVGGDLFRDAEKLEAMRRVDRLCGAFVPWPDFCDRVDLEINDVKDLSGGRNEKMKQAIKIASDTDLAELAKARRLTIILGTCGSGKTEAANIILAAAERDGRCSNIVVGDLRSTSGILHEKIKKAANALSSGDVLVIREHHSHPDLSSLVELAREKNIRILIELQSYPAAPETALELDADWFAMRCIAYNTEVVTPLIGAEFAAKLQDFREGEAIQFSHTRQPRLVRFAMLDNASTGASH